MAERLNFRGTAVGSPTRVMGRITRTPVQKDRGDYILLGDGKDVEGYAAVLLTEAADTAAPSDRPVLVLPDADQFQDGWVVQVDGRRGELRIVFRPESPHNVLFATAACDSRCVMCSQPPLPPEAEDRAQELVRHIDLLAYHRPQYLGITGGEPLLLGDALALVLERLRDRIPKTSIHLLSNGRRLCDPALAQHLADVGHPSLLFSIPLHADVPELHDFVSQVQGAFDQTIAGLLNAASVGLRIELRVILQRATAERLPRIAEFIWSSLPFIEHVAFMALEPIGYARRNWQDVAIEPEQYGRALSEAVSHLHRRCMPASIYNLPLCLTPPELWSFNRRSISDFKQIYAAPCAQCSVHEHCPGLFAWDKSSFLPHIKPVNHALRE